MKLKIAKAVESARISQFKDEMEAFRIIRTSRPWKDFEFRALKGFFSGGLTRVDESDGTYTLRLVCSAETEAAIFRGSPHDGYQRYVQVQKHMHIYSTAVLIVSRKSPAVCVQEPDCSPCQG